MFLFGDRRGKRNSFADRQIWSFYSNIRSNVKLTKRLRGLLFCWLGVEGCFFSRNSCNFWGSRIFDTQMIRQIPSVIPGIRSHFKESDSVLQQKTSTLPKANIAPEELPSQKERIVFQPSIFRGELLVSGRVSKSRHPDSNVHSILQIWPCVNAMTFENPCHFDFLSPSLKNVSVAFFWKETPDPWWKDINCFKNYVFRAIIYEASWASSSLNEVGPPRATLPQEPLLRIGDSFTLNLLEENGELVVGFFWSRILLWDDGLWFPWKKR